jgi:hypothetical protein
LRFGPKLRAWIFVDGKCAFAQLHQFVVEHIGAGVIAAALRLIVGEGELAILRGGPEGQSADGRRCQDHGQTPPAHCPHVGPPYRVVCV